MNDCGVVILSYSYSSFVNWELWWPNFPILVYFKETQTKPEGQVHFFPVIFVSVYGSEKISLDFLAILFIHGTLSMPCAEWKATIRCHGGEGGPVEDQWSQTGLKGSFPFCLLVCPLEELIFRSSSEPPPQLLEAIWNWDALYSWPYCLLEQKDPQQSHLVWHVWCPPIYRAQMGEGTLWTLCSGHHSNCNLLEWFINETARPSTALNVVTDMTWLAQVKHSAAITRLSDSCLCECRRHPGWFIKSRRY